MSDERYTPPGAELDGELPGTPPSTPKTRRILRRILAAALVIGGALGACILVYLVWLNGMQNAFNLLLLVVFGLAYGLAAAAGISLWREREFGRRWGPIIFLTQVPSIGLSNLVAFWYTGLSVLMVFGISPIDFNVHFDFGASFQFYAAGTTVNPGQQWLGINLFALVAAIVLWRTR